MLMFIACGYVNKTLFLFYINLLLLILSVDKLFFTVGKLWITIRVIHRKSYAQIMINSISFLYSTYIFINFVFMTISKINIKRFKVN